MTTLGRSFLASLILIFKHNLIMKKILIPTDFSDLGNFAYGIASVIAKGTNAEITALSIVPGPSEAIYSNSGKLTNDDGNDYSEWEKKLEINKQKLSDWSVDKPEITDTIAIIGQIDNTVLNISQSNDIDLIVMGTEGVFSKTVWSKASHTEYITNHSKIPVLSLKCDRKNVNLKEIVLVSDFLETEKLELKILKDIQKAYESKIILLKILTPSQVRTKENIYADMALFAKHNELTNFQIEAYNADTVESGIGKFAAENDIDLISLGSHQGHGFSKLFRGSISDDVVNHLYHPVLTFPL